MACPASWPGPAARCTHSNVCENPGRQNRKEIVSEMKVRTAIEVEHSNLRKPKVLKREKAKQIVPPFYFVFVFYLQKWAETCLVFSVQTAGVDKADFRATVSVGSRG